MVKDFVEDCLSMEIGSGIGVFYKDTRAFKMNNSWDNIFQAQASDGFTISRW